MTKHSEHDLDLPDWGPYGKEFVGLSHVADADAGHRWDCFLMPGYHRRAVIGPYALRENRWHLWKANAELSSYTLRYELEWKDQVYVDLTVEGTGDARRLRAECVNRTELPVNLDLHVAATLTPNPLRQARVLIPEGGFWVHACEFEQIYFAEGAHRAAHVPDMNLPGAYDQPGAVDGRGMGVQFFKHAGDRVEYGVSLKEPMRDAVLRIRFHRWEDSDCRMRLKLNGKMQDWAVPFREEAMSEVQLDLGDLDAGTFAWALESLGECQILVEGFALLPREQMEEFKVVSCEQKTRAEADWDAAAGRLGLSYPGLDQRYVIEASKEGALRHRRVKGDDVPAIVTERANDSAHSEWGGPGERETQMLSLGPLALAPGEHREIVFRVGQGDQAGQMGEMEPFKGWYPEEIPYAFGMERLAATMFCNVVFPVRRRNAFVKHYCPGKWWDCLYTWDSGMLGLGLASLNVERAKESLNQYLVSPEDAYAAFVSHGTPLPIQVEQAVEIWKRTLDREWLAGVFPKLRNFYAWLAGRRRGSITDRFKTGLLHTFDFNYNSGGWDDYPPQHALISDPERRSRIAPCVTTAYAIRFARHMFRWSEVLGVDGSDYRNDIERWSQALEAAWDEEAGHYSYVEHDAEGHAIGFFRHQSGENYNRGFDGIIPLVAGGLPEEHSAKLIELFFDENELWTPWGGTTVSKRAAYYSDSGYWNGAVWMPHNVMIWRALRELGEVEKARKLAEALLGTWEREARASYHSFELFRADTGRGSGWHQFSGLSAPLLMMYGEEFGDGSD
jgi:hypothetical protein